MMMMTKTMTMTTMMKNMKKEKEKKNDEYDVKCLRKFINRRIH